MLIPAESLSYFENMIYIPMVITVLEQDREIVEHGDFKLKRPYTELIERAIKEALKDLKDTKAYMRQNGLRIERGTRDETTTEFTFYF